MPRNARSAALVLVLSLAMFCASTAPPPAPRPGESACTFTIANVAGELRVYYEKAEIVGEVEGRDEWWIYFPRREPVIDRDGHPRGLNWPKSKILRFGEARIVGTVLCRCPQNL